MKLFEKITNYISIVIAGAGILMFGGLVLSATIREGNDNYAKLLINYGCYINPVSIPLFIASIVIYLLCAAINNSQQGLGYKRPFKQTVLSSFDFKLASEGIKVLSSVSYLLLGVFLFSRLSYFWNFCA